MNTLNFEIFKDRFYQNTSNTKMMLHIDLEDNIDETNIYDIHSLLLDLLMTGFNKLDINVSINLEESIKILQRFFNNIDIRINIINYTKKDIINDESIYLNHYIKFTIENINNMLINGKHELVDELNYIKSFFLIDDLNNLCISFKQF